LQSDNEPPDENALSKLQNTSLSQKFQEQLHDKESEVLVIGCEEAAEDNKHSHQELLKEVIKEKLKL